MRQPGAEAEGAVACMPRRECTVPFPLYALPVDLPFRGGGGLLVVGRAEGGVSAEGVRGVCWAGPGRAGPRACRGAGRAGPRAIRAGRAGEWTEPVRAGPGRAGPGRFGGQRSSWSGWAGLRKSFAVRAKLCGDGPAKFKSFVRLRSINMQDEFRHSVAIFPISFLAELGVKVLKYYRVRTPAFL